MALWVVRMQEGGKTTLWWSQAIFGLVHIVILEIPVIYWRCRDLDPIKNRRPRLLSATGAVIAAFCLHQVARNLWKSQLGTWWDVLLGAALLSVSTEGFFVFTISLYVAFNKTQDQIRYEAAIPASLSLFVMVRLQAQFSSDCLSS